MKHFLRLSPATLVCVLLGACSGIEHKDVEPTSISMADKELAESELLDVGIETFDPGTEVEEGDAEEGVFPRYS